MTRIAKPGTLLLEIPELGTKLFVSPDATAWSAAAAQTIPPRELSLSAAFAAPGYYLAATSLPELASQPGRSNHTAVVLGISTAVVALFLFAGRVRHRAPAAATHRFRRRGVMATRAAARCRARSLRRTSRRSSHPGP